MIHIYTRFANSFETLVHDMAAFVAPLHYVSEMTEHIFAQELGGFRAVVNSNILVNYILIRSIVVRLLALAKAFQGYLCVRKIHICHKHFQLSSNFIVVLCYVFFGLAQS